MAHDHPQHRTLDTRHRAAGHASSAAGAKEAADASGLGVGPRAYAANDAVQAASGAAVTTLLYLFGLHFLCDFALQGDYMARAKDRFAGNPAPEWFWALGGHALIHGAAVCLLLGCWLGVAEAAAHCAIDYAKCARRISYDVDQTLHLASKVMWFALAEFWVNT